MNGVRRFLSGGNQSPSPSSTPPPLSVSKPSWPPNPVDINSTPALVLRKQQKKPSESFHKQSSPSNPSSSSSPMPKSKNNSPVPDLASPWTPNSSFSQSQTRGSGLLNTRDELLMSLLTSEAVVDSRDFEILSAEEVEELKKEEQVLSSRLGAMSKKLTLETKIRDAAVSLSKVNASHKRVSKQTDEQLEAATHRVDSAQRELWRVSERAHEVHKRLLEHRAGVLGFSVRSLEKKMIMGEPNGDMTGGSGYNSPNWSLQMSPSPSSVLGTLASPRPRFDGAHLFAGHADATIPQTPKGPTSNSDVATLQAQLKEATDVLNAMAKKEADLARELSHLRLEKEQVETTMGMELQSAEETIISLEKELPRLDGLSLQLTELQREKRVWERERETLEGRLEVLEEKSGNVEQLLTDAREKNRAELRRKDEELQELRAQLAAEKSESEADRMQWHKDKALLEDAKREEIARLRAEMDVIWSRERASLQTEMNMARSRDSATIQKVNAELETAENALRSLAAKHGIPVMSGGASLSELIDSIGLHLEEIASQLQTPGGSLKDLSDANKVAAVLQPVWAMLPSPEARAAKLGSRHGSTRSGSQGTISPITLNASASSLQNNINLALKGPPASLSDMDVRALKTLYDSRTSPSSPNTAVFSVEAFATRVQALIVDDRSLIERLLRFAQAHDLLKKNAERAQKLATEGNNALETYQKQVRTLEERNLTTNAKQNAMQEEIINLQDIVDGLTQEKQDLERRVAELAQTCRQLTDANDTLTTRTFALAEEATVAPEKIRKELMAQLAECKASLQEAQEELDAMRTSEQSQTEALLDELNSMQTENGNLRAQLRAVRK